MQQNQSIGRTPNIEHSESMNGDEWQMATKWKNWGKWIRDANINFTFIALSVRSVIRFDFLVFDFIFLFWILLLSLIASCDDISIRISWYHRVNFILIKCMFAFAFTFHIHVHIYRNLCVGNSMLGLFSGTFFSSGEWNPKLVWRNVQPSA